MKTPIYVYEPNDLDVFESVSDAELKVEPIDVRNGEFVYFDAEGRMLRARVVASTQSEKVVISDEGDGSDPLFLRQLLIDFLEGLEGERAPLEAMELPELVRKSLRFLTK